ncbi:hypothetical protein DFH09DRAFT_1211319, partial [Mycena vulgaris]
TVRGGTVVSPRRRALALRVSAPRSPCGHVPWAERGGWGSPNARGRLPCLRARRERRHRRDVPDGGFRGVALALRCTRGRRRRADMGCARPRLYRRRATRTGRRTGTGTRSRRRGRDRPVLLLLGIRLGLDGMNPFYHETIEMLYAFPQSVGIADGRPLSSYYFVGAQGNGLPRGVRARRAAQFRLCAYGVVEPRLCARGINESRVQARARARAHAHDGGRAHMAGIYTETNVPGCAANEGRDGRSGGVG